MLLIIDNFFKDRWTRNMVNSAITEWTGTDVGVTQGSILSVILFLIFFGDISDNIGSHVKFADDLTLWKTDSTPQRAADLLTQDLRLKKICLVCVAAEANFFFTISQMYHRVWAPEFRHVCKQNNTA